MHRISFAVSATLECWSVSRGKSSLNKASAAAHCVMSMVDVTLKAFQRSGRLGTSDAYPLSALNQTCALQACSWHIEGDV